MQCQRCAKPATYHVTDLHEGQFAREVHLCEQHAREYFSKSPSEPSKSSSPDGTSLSNAATDTADAVRSAASQVACSECGTTLEEFRATGRFGCPNDYEAFEPYLNSLLMTIHGAMDHHGKQPTRKPLSRQRRRELFRLRQALKEAIATEDYEHASQLRDAIRALERLHSSDEPASPA